MVALGVVAFKVFHSIDAVATLWPLKQRKAKLWKFLLLFVTETQPRVFLLCIFNTKKKTNHTNRITSVFITFSQFYFSACKISTFSESLILKFRHKATFSSAAAFL